MPPATADGAQCRFLVASRTTARFGAGDAGKGGDVLHDLILVVIVEGLMVITPSTTYTNVVVGIL